MNRALTLALLEVRTAWRRPSLWVFLAILLFLTWGFAAGTVTIGSGSGVAGGERAHLNSEFNLAYGDILVFTLFYVFFACTAFGNAPSEDDALRVMPIVGSTGLSPGQYVVGRWLGIAIVYSAIVAVHLALQVGFFELYPLPEPVVLARRVAERRAGEEHVEEREDEDVAEGEVELAVQVSPLPAGDAAAAADRDGAGGESPGQEEQDGQEHPERRASPGGSDLEQGERQGAVHGGGSRGWVRRRKRRAWRNRRAWHRRRGSRPSRRSTRPRAWRAPA